MSLSFSPDQPLSGGIEIVENAIVVPFGQGKKQGIARPAGVLYPDGTHCIPGQSYRSEVRPTTVPPIPPDPSEVQDEIKGTVLFGGIAYGHFGHGLCETTSRLWALDHVEEPIDSVLFFPRREMTWPRRCLPQIEPVMSLFAPIPALAAAGKPTRVERLIVAPPGFGVGEMAAGCPEFRHFARTRLRARSQADGGEKLYISRSQLFRKRGRLLFEQQIEAWMQAEGYEIFHPQQHDTDTQLARYRAARRIVSTDNSALHLAAFVMEPDCEVAIIKRRPGNIIHDFNRQLTHFAGVTPTVSDHIQKCWSPASAAVRMNEVMTLVDLEQIGADLARAGFIADAGPWQAPSQAALDAEIAEFEARIEEPLKQVV